MPFQSRDHLIRATAITIGGIRRFEAMRENISDWFKPIDTITDPDVKHMVGRAKVLFNVIKSVDTDNEALDFIVESIMDTPYNMKAWYMLCSIYSTGIDTEETMTAIDESKESISSAEYKARMDSVKTAYDFQQEMMKGIETMKAKKGMR